jgi:hypothetical protein
MYVGGNRSPWRKPTLSERESPTLSHEELVGPGIEPTTSEVTGADVNFEHRSYHCATLTPHCTDDVTLFVIVLSTRIVVLLHVSKKRLARPTIKYAKMTLILYAEHIKH